MLWLNGSLYGLRIHYAIIFQEIPPAAKESFGVFLDGNYDIKNKNRNAYYSRILESGN